MNVIFWSGGLSKYILRRYVGPYKIAHYIRKHGYTAQVIDFLDKFTTEGIVRLTSKFVTGETMVLAIATTFLSANIYSWSDGTRRRIPEHISLAIDKIRETYPHIKIVVGGYMSERLPIDADASIMSYVSATEDIFLEYLEFLQGRGPEPYGSMVTPALVGKNKKPRIMYSIANSPKYNIETDDFKFTKQDAILRGEPLPLDVSRGCIFACRFCQYPHLGKKKLDYIRGMEYLQEEIENNYSNFGTTNYYILDDTFNDTEIKLKSFHSMTESLPFKIKYSSYLRADLIHRFPDMAHYLQESGLFGAYHGIESLHPEASKLVGKAWSGTHARDFIPELYHNIWNKQVPMHTNFIVGITHDTVENVRSTADWFIDNQLYSIEFNPLGLYGVESNSIYTIQSEFDKNAEKYGFKFTGMGEGGLRTWENDNWTDQSAKKLASEMNKLVLNHKKVHLWFIPALLWYGVKPETILSKPSEWYSWLNWMPKRTTLKLSQYYDLLDRL